MRDTTHHPVTAVPALTHVLDALSARALVPAGVHDDARECLHEVATDDQSSFVVKLLMGVGAWLATPFLLVFFIATLDLEHSATALFALGGMHLTVGVALGRNTRSIFATQFALAASVIGKALLVGAFVVMGLLGFSDLEVAILASVLVAAATYPITRLDVDRFLSTLAPLCLAIIWVLDERVTGGLHALMALQAGMFVVAFGMQRMSATLRPMGYASAVGLLGTAFSQMGFAFLSAQPGWGSVFPGLDPRTVPTTIILAATLVYACVWAAGDWAALLRRPLRHAVIASVALLALSAVAPLALLVALVLIVFGFARSDRKLLSLGLVALPFGLAAYYFHLGIPLAWKSAALLVSGGVALVAWAYVHSHGAMWFASAPTILTDDVDDRTAIPSPNAVGVRPALWSATGRWYGALTVGVVVLFNTLIARQEILYAVGDTMYVELAPVDPRSLMQGDYMILRYALARKLPSVTSQDSGTAVVRLDDNRVARFVRMYAGGEIQSGEHLLRYRVREGRVEIASGAYFFQEGHGAYYSQAEYAELRVDDAGRATLVGLRTGAFELLERPTEAELAAAPLPRRRNRRRIPLRVID